MLTEAQRRDIALHLNVALEEIIHGSDKRTMATTEIVGRAVDHCTTATTYTREQVLETWCHIQFNRIMRLEGNIPVER